jgi:integrase
MSRRRGHGEGSVHKRADGRWVGVVDLGWQNGKRVRKYLYGHTQEDVIGKLRKAQTTAADGLPLPDERRTVKDYLAWWSTSILPTPRMKESTAEDYRHVIDRYITPHIGKVPLAKLTPSHVHSMQAALTKQGLGPSTVRYARAVLSGALRHAERWGLVTRNVVRLVDAPRKAAPKTDDALTLDEAKKLLAHVRGKRLEAFVSVGLALGLRRGEVLALRWDDIDLEGRTLTVPGTLKRRPGGGLYLDTPKTGASAATIPLPATCVETLTAHRRRQAQERLAAGQAWQDDGFVFTTPVGTPIDGSNALKAFYDICEGAGIPRRRFHALRHSAATLMWEQGVPLDIISATLRHSGLSITKDIYVTFRADVMRTGADAIDRALGASAEAS